MRTIRISEEVWEEIARRGVFGETPDIVLRRILNIDKGSELKKGGSEATAVKKRPKKTKNRLSKRFDGNILFLEFDNGVSNEFELPDKGDKNEVSRLTYNVMQFIKENGGTIGQINAGRKALTDAGYHIYGPVSR